ncbi:MAG: nucleotidyl transferase AbiEii/AbiGii toxin family protein [Actinobacteria bacterium]|nr:nucleotidyl transferase AbiEii/AbiGii toxin family protein [Actinomycetota bacterium]
MISADELRAHVAAFGVPEDQIMRDHLISHVLRALSETSNNEIVFFGGTALCRTWCADSRLSEDIDLLVDDHNHAAQTLPSLVSRGIRREFPDTRWEDGGRRHEVDTKILLVGDAIALNVQFARWRSDWRGLPVTSAEVRLRYSDLPEHVLLTVPTGSSFVAMKLIAWGDRHTPRDLFDLHDLALRGYFTSVVPALVKEITGAALSLAMLESRVPRQVEESWEAELGHQLGDLPCPATCLDVVREALGRLEGEA